MSPEADLHAALARQHLAVLAACAPDPEFCPPHTLALALIGPASGAWWTEVTASPEWQDGAPNPIDRLSKRLLGDLARRFGGVTLFPSDGPPWPPFFRWALGSGQIWQSPVGMLVHADTGLWLSFRGALALPFSLPQTPAANPCDSCETQPCRSACPVDALTPTTYDTAACHTHLDTPQGRDCLDQGCRARRACPASQSHGRMNIQSAYHMSIFHPWPRN